MEWELQKTSLFTLKADEKNVKENWQGIQKCEVYETVQMTGNPN